ncbi:MAG: hypothetical protein II767_10645 [Proteobacteria bacterium]|nr:hypothetical protein [Pseudomonadota bacterium]
MERLCMWHGYALHTPRMWHGYRVAIRRACGTAIATRYAAQNRGNTPMVLPQTGKIVYIPVVFPHPTGEIVYIPVVLSHQTEGYAALTLG